MKVGVIDIGTLKVKFLIAKIGKYKEVKTLYSSNTYTRLGSRILENNNRPQTQYIQATIDELKRCKKILEKEKVKKIRVISTHALREIGKAGQEVADLINIETGFKVDIISQIEEAELFFRAVTADFKSDQEFTIVDVGGGSVQALIGSKNKLKKKFLLKIGTAYLFDRFNLSRLETDFPNQAEINNMQKYIKKELEVLPVNIKTPVIYGSSCVIDVFKKIGLKMEAYNISRSHPYLVKVSEMKKFLDKITPIPYGERQKIYKLDQEYYMWGLDKAFLDILSICERINAPFVLPSNENINNGLILSMLH